VHRPLPVTFELEHFGNGAVLPILRKMTAKSADERYATYDDVRFAITRLGDVVEGSGRLAPRPPAFRVEAFGVRQPSTAEVPLEERLDTFHQIETVPLDEKGGVSMAGFASIRMPGSAGSGSMASTRTAAGRSDSDRLSKTLRRAREDAAGTIGDVVGGGRIALVLGLVLLVVAGVSVAVFSLMGKGKSGAKPATIESPVAASTSTAAPLHNTPKAVVHEMQPLPLTEQSTATLRSQLPVVTLQSISAQLLHKKPPEVLRVLGTPDFTDETERGGGMYYRSEQWAVQLMDELTSRPVGRVKVFFFNGQCTAVEGAQ
jgi:hypothetical protein